MDWLLLLLPVALVIFGALVINSTQQNIEPGIYGWNHIILGVIGLLIALWLSRSRYEHLVTWHWIIYGVINVLLVVVLFIGTVGSGAQSWLGLFWFLCPAF